MCFGIFRVPRILAVCLLLLPLTVSALLPDQLLRSPDNHKFMEAFEARLLTMFGLSTRPRPKGKPFISQYMIDLYKDQSKALTTNFDLKDKHIRTANTVRSFDDTESKADRRYGNSRYRFRFNISTIPNKELLIAAELRIHRPLLSTSDSKVYRRHTKTPLVQRVSVYDVLHPATKRQDALLRLLDTREIVLNSEEHWESFDVLPAVQRWRQGHQYNGGLLVQTTTADGHRDSPQEHLHLHQLPSMNERTWHTVRPMLITYTDDGRNIQSLSRRTRRSPSDSRKGKRKQRNSCQRHSLYVDFSDVGWNDWIVAPPGYQAFFCQGDCPFPLPDHLNATNHAIVQTLVNSVNPSKAPKACCVPTELSPISMLYLDEYDKVVLKNYQDMVVEGCGCR